MNCMSYDYLRLTILFSWVLSVNGWWQQALSRGPAKGTERVRNGKCQEYPYCFEGRFRFSPSLVRIEDDALLDIPQGVSMLSFLGYSFGGSVVLEYDESPVGPYYECVSLGGLVTKRGAIGQWGNRLLVSTKEAEDICYDVWGVPAEVASIELDGQEGDMDNSGIGRRTRAMSRRSNDDLSIQIRNWDESQLLNSKTDDGADKKDRPRFGGIPILWTPSIKALWFVWSPWLNFSKESAPEDKSLLEDDRMSGASKLPLHQLRLSASGIKVLVGTSDNDSLQSAVASPNLKSQDLGFSLVVDNVLIEISENVGSL